MTSRQHLKRARRIFRRRHEVHFQINPLAIAIDAKMRCLANNTGSDTESQRFRRQNLSTINGNNHIPNLQPGLIGGTVRMDPVDQHATRLVEAETICHITGDFLTNSAEPRPNDLASREAIGQNRLHHIGRDGKPNAE